MTIKIKKLEGNDYDKVQCLLDLDKADADLLSALNSKSQSLYGVLDNTQYCGLAQVEQGKKAYVYVYIDERYRKNNLGKKAIFLCEHALDNETEKIVTSYRTEDKVSKLLAHNLGYKRTFASTYMTYSGKTFSLDQDNIRHYRDEDYNQAHKLYAKAFHDMRVSVGDFPDSVVEAPSEKMRESWAKTSHERLVYIHDKEIVAYARVIGHDIASISVESNHQGKGIGRKFIKYICNQILNEGHKSIDLYCVVGNKAKHLYDHLGFKDVHIVEFAEKEISK